MRVQLIFAIPRNALRQPLPSSRSPADTTLGSQFLSFLSLWLGLGTERAPLTVVDESLVDGTVYIAIETTQANRWILTMARAVALEMQEGLSARFLGSQVYSTENSRFDVTICEVTLVPEVDLIVPLRTAYLHLAAYLSRFQIVEIKRISRNRFQVTREAHWGNPPYHDMRSMRSNDMEGMIVVQCDQHSEMLERVAEAGGYGGYRSAGLQGGTPAAGAVPALSSGSAVIVSDYRIHANMSVVFAAGDPQGLKSLRDALGGTFGVVEIVDQVIVKERGRWGGNRNMERAKVPGSTIPADQGDQIRQWIADVDPADVDPAPPSSEWEFGPEGGSEIFTGGSGGSGGTVIGRSGRRDETPAPDYQPAPGFNWERLPDGRIAWFAPSSSSISRPSTPPPPAGGPPPPPGTPPPSPPKPKWRTRVEKDEETVGDVTITPLP